MRWVSSQGCLTTIAPQQRNTEMHNNNHTRVEISLSLLLLLRETARRARVDSLSHGRRAAQGRHGGGRGGSGTPTAAAGGDLDSRRRGCAAVCRAVLRQPLVPLLLLPEELRSTCPEREAGDDEDDHAHSLEQVEG